MKKVIFSLIGVALIALGILMYPKNGQPETQPEVSVKIIEVEAPEATLDTSDWKEFRSEKFGISFKTPADWNNREGEDGIGLNYLGYDSFGSIMKSGFETEDEMINFLTKRDRISKMDMFFNKNGVKFYKSETVLSLYYFADKDVVYEITGLQDTIPTIITTLQLIEE